jgi:3-keto-5-aminohexanoate cleavage enzyme
VVGTKPFIIEAAINGGVTMRVENPNLPCTATEVAADSAAALDAGASIVHTHLRRADGSRIDDYGELLEEHRDAFRLIRCAPAPLLWNTFPLGGDATQRFRLFRDLAADRSTRPDLGAYDIGSLNIVWFDETQRTWRSNTYINTFDDVCTFLRGFKELALRPFLNIFEPGFIRSARAALDLGLLDEPLLIKLYFSDRYGVPPCEQSIELYLTLLDGIAHEWFGCYIDADVLPYVPLFASMGGHVRVGLEDYAYASHGALSNAEIVGRAAQAARPSGRPVATVADARRLMALDGNYHALRRTR